MNNLVGRFWFRLLIFSSLLVPPFLRMLLQHDYGLIHPEVAVSLVIITGVAVCLAGLLRNRWAFHASVGVLLTLLSVNALRVDFVPWVRVRWVLPGTALALAISMFVLRRHFYQVLLIFIGSALAVDVGQAMLTQNEPANAVSAAHNRNFEHVVHIVLDEMIGLGGMPSQLHECTAAGEAIRNVLEERAFDIYPYAFSNYLSTRDSLPSILNGRLLERQGEFVAFDARRPMLRQNLYFDHYRKQGYALRVYQSDWLLYASDNSESVRTREYKFVSLKALHAAPLSWTTRLRYLFVVYLESDRFWSGIWTFVVPNADPETLRFPIVPLGLKGLWPDQVIADYRSATEKSLFFVHVLIPHSPSVYRADGSFTDPRGWSHTKEFVAEQKSEYIASYRQYCAQVQFVSSQLKTLLDGLKSSGSYGSTTVIVHGDHGSKFRLLRSDEQDAIHRLRSVPASCPPMQRYDYIKEPDSQDLLSRFSTLLAIKMRGATMSRIIPESGSVLFFLGRAFPFLTQSNSVEDLNAVYMFNLDGSPRKMKTMTRAFDVQPLDRSVSTRAVSLN